jgi:hypothetical protein
MAIRIRTTVAIVLFFLLALACFAFILFVGSMRYTDGDGKTYHARLECQNLQKACKSYYVICNEYPKALSNLVQPPFQDKSLIEGGVRALIDPWGNPCQFVIVKDSNGTGDVFPVVFTIDPKGRKIAWPREYGDI